MSELPINNAIQRRIEELDATLARGREAIAKVDLFYQEHNLVPGVGEASLLSDVVPERHRAIFSKLLAEFDNIDRRITELDPDSTRPSPLPVAARAVGNRYRI